MPDELNLLTRAHRYELKVYPLQVEAFERSARGGRRYWNNLVASLRWAEREIRHGRRGSIVKAYEALLLQKKSVGRACVVAKKRMASDGGSFTEALRLARQDRARREGAMIKTRDRKVTLRARSRRKLAVAYAIETVESTRGKKGAAASDAVAHGIIEKFQACCGLYIDGKRGRPKFKGGDSPISLQYAVTKSSRDPLTHHKQETFVNLNLIAGATCVKVPVIFHRPLPDGALIKRVTLTINHGRHYVTFQFQAPRAALVKSFAPAPNEVAGLKTGRRVAASVSPAEGNGCQAIQPPFRQDAKHLQKVRRLQRKFDRQQRAANPDCFDEQGRRKRGHRNRVETKGMRETKAELGQMAANLINARTDAYHRAAIALLNRYDALAADRWRGGTASGSPALRRASLRKDSDNAVGSFIAVLKDKAFLASTPKTVVDADARSVTPRCEGCGAEATKEAQMKKETWTCPACGKVNPTNFCIARAMARALKGQMAAGAQSGVAADESPENKRRRRP